MFTHIHTHAHGDKIKLFALALFALAPTSYALFAIPFRAPTATTKNAPESRCYRRWAPVRFCDRRAT